MTAPSVFILAVEPSADKLGADLIQSLRQHHSTLSIFGIGGDEMAKTGIDSDIDISGLAIMGYFEVVKAYGKIRQKIRESVSVILQKAPDAVVLIDSWGFMIRVAEGLRKAGFQGRIIKYVAPQVWAMRPGRAKTLARYCDHLLSIQTMDKPYFEAVGLAQTYVGNPMFDEDFSPEQGGDFEELSEFGDGPVVSVLFGSRESEVNALFVPFMETVEKVRANFPDAIIATVIPSNVSSCLKTYMKNDRRSENLIVVDERNKKALFARSVVALACSGTVTTQLAMSGTPSVVAYKLSPLTYSLGKGFFRPNHISLVNISADERIIPEFLQSEVTAENLFQALSKFLIDEKFRDKTSQRLQDQVQIMKGKGGSASQRAALAILKDLNAV